MQENLSRKEIGIRIKSLRTEMNHSQAFMANLLQTSRSNYSQIEIGNQYPTLEILGALARYYRRSYEWLLHGDEIFADPINSPGIIKALPQPSALKIGAILKISASSDYIKKLNDAAYLSGLSIWDLSLEILNREGYHRAFVPDHSPCLNNVFSGDVLVGKLLGNLSQVVLNEIYTVITLEEMIFCKIVDIVSDGEVLIYKNDENKKRFTLNFNDIQEIWEVVGKYSTVIQPKNGE
jgi:transcriptional regulator with XRE-family HTH domain